MTSAPCDIARDPVATLPSDASLDLAVAKMAELYLQHVLATDPATGVPCGIISSFDIASVIGGHPREGARRLRRGPTHPASSVRALREAIVGDVMRRGVVTCAPDAPLRAVGRSMAQHRVHCVAVAGVDASGAHAHHFNWGLIDDMDLVRALHRGALDDCAGAIAATGPIAVLERDSLEVAATADASGRHSPRGRGRGVRPSVRHGLHARYGVHPRRHPRSRPCCPATRRGGLNGCRTADFGGPSGRRSARSRARRPQRAA